MRKTLVSVKTVPFAQEDVIDVFVDIKFGNHGAPFSYGICLGQNGGVNTARGVMDEGFTTRQLQRPDRNEEHRANLTKGLQGLTGVSDRRELIAALRADLRSIGKLVPGELPLWGNRQTLIFLQEAVRTGRGLRGNFLALESAFSFEEGGESYSRILKRVALEAGLKGMPYNPLSTCQTMALLKYRYESLNRKVA